MFSIWTEYVLRIVRDGRDSQEMRLDHKLENHCRARRVVTTRVSHMRSLLSRYGSNVTQMSHESTCVTPVTSRLRPGVT